MAEMLRENGESAVVPRTGMTAVLTAFSAGAMAFLTVFALALSIATGKLADRWEAELANNATVRITASEAVMEDRVATVLRLLQTTPGVAAARALSSAEQRALLEPWFGPDLPVEELPMPQLIEVTEDTSGFDVEGLNLRLEAEAPGAVLDDHGRWRAPLATAAQRLRAIATLSIVLITGVMAAMITLAAQAALAANAQVIGVLRLVGARDGFIASAFVRRFTLRALAGAAGGTLMGALAVSILPDAQDSAGALLTGLSFRGWQWLWLFLIPPLAAAVAFAATMHAARRALRALA
ncbi:MAG: FtsX-like permease family protein [Pseudomonadota bacterium]